MPAKPDCVLFKEHPRSDGKIVAEAVLNAPRRYNALDLDMVTSLLAKFSHWQHSETIAAVILRGAGERSFCAGGDVVAARESALQNPGGPCPEAEELFRKEYQLDHLLHVYPKPIFCFGHGYVMGGGMGLFQGCRFRFLERRSTMAMPEVAIGLFSDVGAGVFFNNMTHDVGMYLALTGAQLNDADAVFLGLTDRVYDEADTEQIIEQLIHAPAFSPSEALESICDQLASRTSRSISPVAEHLDNILACLEGEDLATIVERIKGERSSPWLLKNAESLERGSPLAVVNTYHHLKRCRDLGLAEVFKADLDLAINCMRHREFSEGVRALLVDKDKRPRWRFASVDEVPSSLREKMMSTPL